MSIIKKGTPRVSFKIRRPFVKIRSLIEKGSLGNLIQMDLPSVNQRRERITLIEIVSKMRK
jgi:hypothetical protein